MGKLVDLHQKKFEKSLKYFQSQLENDELYLLIKNIFEKKCLNDHLPNGSVAKTQNEDRYHQKTALILYGTEIENLLIALFNHLKENEKLSANNRENKKLIYLGHSINLKIIYDMISQLDDFQYKYYLIELNIGQLISLYSVLKDEINNYSLIENEYKETIKNIKSRIEALNVII